MHLKSLLLFNCHHFSFKWQTARCAYYAAQLQASLYYNLPPMGLRLFMHILILFYPFPRNPLISDFSRSLLGVILWYWFLFRMYWFDPHKGLIIWVKSTPRVFENVTFHTEKYPFQLCLNLQFVGDWKCHCKLVSSSPSRTFLSPFFHTPNTTKTFFKIGNTLKLMN